MQFIAYTETKIIAVISTAFSKKSWVIKYQLLNTFVVEVIKLLLFSVLCNITTFARKTSSNHSLGIVFTLSLSGKKGMDKSAFGLVSLLVLEHLPVSALLVDLPLDKRH